MATPLPLNSRIAPNGLEMNSALGTVILPQSLGTKSSGSS